MKLGVKIALISVLIYIIMVLVFLLTGFNENEQIMLYLLGGNTLFLFVAVALSILINFNRNRAGGLSMLVDIKMGLTASAVYALVVSSFLLLYFTQLDPDYQERRKEHAIAAMQEDKALEVLEDKMAENPDAFAGKSVEDIQERNMDNAEHILSAKTIFPITLFTVLLLGMVYSFLVTAFNRLILVRLG